jgi:hypothetical protein
MSKGTGLGMVFGLALLAVLVLGGYLLLELVGEAFSSLDPQTRTLAAIGTVVALVSAVIVAEGARARGGTDKGLPAQRALVYERLLTVCRDQIRLRGARPQKAAESAEVESSLALHGSAAVISAYLELRSTDGNDGEGATRADLLKRLVVAMRRDLGRQELITKENELLELIAEADDADARALHE